MSERIGYQHGIRAFAAWLRRQPGVQPRGPGYNPDDVSTWPWPDRLERTLRILAADHDAAVGPTPPPPPPPPPPPVGKFAPQTHNPTPRADARYCVQGLPRRDDGRHYEPSDPAITYSENGLCWGGRTADRIVAGLKGSDSMDGMEPCAGYTKDGVTYGPGVSNWPAESYLR